MRSLRLSGLSGLSVVLLAALTLTGCGSSGSPSSNGGSTPSPSSTPTVADAHHTIDVTFDDPLAGKDSGYIGKIAKDEGVTPQEFAETILKNGEVEGIMSGFASNFILPEDLHVHVRNDEGSPYYDPSTKTINIFYDFANLTGDIIKEAQSPISDEDLGTQWAAVNDFVLVHELAHAFVDVLKKPDGTPGIPVTGREEDAADGMATYFFTDYVQNGPEYAFAAAQFFAALQNFQGSPDATQFADEHSLSITRAGDIACKVAGSSDQNMAAVAQLGGQFLTEARLQRCPAEYQQMSEAWSALLNPFLRNGSSASPSPSETATP